jgi:hypothetical protein
MEGWRAGGLEGWRAGGLEGWRAGGLEGWRGKPSLPRMDEVRPWEAVGIEKA